MATIFEDTLEEGIREDLGVIGAIVKEEDAPGIGEVVAGEFLALDVGLDDGLLELVVDEGAGEDPAVVMITIFCAAHNHSRRKNMTFLIEK